MRVLLVEDDPLQKRSIERALRHNFLKIEIDSIRTESEFFGQFGAIRSEPPDLVLLDVMLPWAAASANSTEPPPEVQLEGYYRAGLRCLDKLLDAPETHDIPTILYSVLSREDVSDEISKAPPNVLFLQKGSDDLLVVRHIRSLMMGLLDVEVQQDSWQQRLWESIEVKPGWMGFSIDLKGLIEGNRKRDNN